MNKFLPADNGYWQNSYIGRGSENKNSGIYFFQSVIYCIFWDGLRIKVRSNLFLHPDPEKTFGADRICNFGGDVLFFCSLLISFILHSYFHCSFVLVSSFSSALLFLLLSSFILFCPPFSLLYLCLLFCLLLSSSVLLSSILSSSVLFCTYISSILSSFVLFVTSTVSLFCPLLSSSVLLLLLLFFIYSTIIMYNWPGFLQFIFSG